MILQIKEEGLMAHPVPSEIYFKTFQHL